MLAEACYLSASNASEPRVVDRRSPRREVDRSLPSTNPSRTLGTHRFLDALLERIAARTGRVVYKRHLVWLLDAGWRAPYEKYLEGDARKRRSSLRIGDRRFVLVQLARSVLGLEGSTAECGVYTGVGSALICKTLMETYGEKDRHFGFDSFEGVAEPGEADRSSLATWWKKGDLATPIEVARGRLEEFPFSELVTGWMPECFSTSAARDHRFRFVHVDVDLHDATRDSLEFFYPRLVPGGVVLLDDHGFASCPGARKAAQDFFADKPEPVIELPTGQAFVTRR
jgi:hypothetical protein